ncbi:hypothetical protein KEM48_009564 [Puccinia striiformis f. sp. tritici PST-130]|nr:hypothetical protein KEM48_009731 [Puccinia striiformis f. sp. tritici PST-130]KAI9623134.1 hypothetical protein KEM48_009564 [Puccinia striiformis f. sp. tritici PST-130]
MLQFSRLIFLASLIAPWGVTSEEVYFGCHKNVDAICSKNVENDDGQVTLTWAERLHPKKRRYKCPEGVAPLCCSQNTFDINGVKTPALGHGTPLLVLVRASNEHSLPLCSGFGAARLSLLCPSLNPISCELLMLSPLSLLISGNV